MKILPIITCVFLSLIAKESYGGCSDAAGKATFNEVYKLTTGTGTASFIEIKIIDETVTRAVYEEWTVKICYEPSNNNLDCVTYNVSDFTDKFPWLYIQTPTFDDDYLDFKDGFDITLRGDVTDNGGADSQEVIDYLVTDNFFEQNLGSCSTDDLPYWLSSQNTNNGTKLTKRVPDGIGNWEIVNSNDESETPGYSNDGTTVDHFEISHDGQGLTCEAESITIKACADAACSTLYNDAIDVDLSINSTVDKTVTVSGGSTSTSFSYTNVGTATLSLDQTYECKNGASTSCDVVFSEAGFVLDINGANDVESCDATKSLLIKAVKLSENGVSCAPAFTGPQSLDFTFNYQNPTSGTKVPKLNTTNMAAAGVSQPRTVTFNGDGEATIAIQYDDAGALDFSVSEATFSGVSSATLSKEFYPPELAVSTALTSIDSNGTVTQRAGVDFPISLIAQCQNGITTPNYLPQTNATLQLSVQQKEPTVNTGALTIGSVDINATNLTTTQWTSIGQSAINFNGKYSEVGIINLAAQDTNYFGNVVNSASYSTAGRFIPDHFEQTVVEQGGFDSICNQNTPFAYTGQVLVSDASKGAISYLVNPVVELTAKNALGGTTKNYTEPDYMKLIAATDFIVKPTTDSVITGNNSNPLPLTANMFAGTVSYGLPLASGVLQYELADEDNFVYIRNENSEVNAQDNDIDFVIDQTNFRDSDDIAITTPVDITGTAGVNLRFGRAYLENSFGPETSDLPQPFSTQYLNTSGNFVTNDLDGCTNFDAAKIILTSGTLNKNLTGVNAANGLLDTGETRAMLLTVPGSGNQGTVNVEYDIYSWLKYDWNWDGVSAKVFDENPSATATFGLFRGNDRIIYQREVNN